MLRLAVAAAILSGASPVLAQPLLSASVGAGSDGLAAFASAGPDLGRLSPHVFVSHTARTEQLPFAPDGERDFTESRVSVGVVGRLMITPPAGRVVEVAAFSGVGYTSARRSSQVLVSDGEFGRTLSQTGLTAVLVGQLS